MGLDCALSLMVPRSVCTVAVNKRQATLSLCPSLEADFSTCFRLFSFLFSRRILRSSNLCIQIINKVEVFYLHIYTTEEKSVLHIAKPVCILLSWSTYSAVILLCGPIFLLRAFFLSSLVSSKEQEVWSLPSPCTSFTSTVPYLNS